MSRIRKAQGEDLVESKQTTRILNRLLPGVERHRTSWQAWEKGCTSEERKAIDSAVKRAVSSWKEEHPKGNYERNRAQIRQGAIKSTFEQLSKENPEFQGKWEEEAKLDVPLSRDQLSVINLLQSEPRFNTFVIYQRTGPHCGTRGCRIHCTSICIQGKDGDPYGHYGRLWARFLQDIRVCSI